MKQSKGRKTLDGAEVRRVQVMLDDASINKARLLGGGNVSAGIRRAVNDCGVFDFDGSVWLLSAMLEANRHDKAMCDWLIAARVGESLGECTRIA